MAEGPYLLGIDYGTGGVRVGIFDREGNPSIFHGEEFGTSYPRPAWAEQSWASCRRGAGCSSSPTDHDARGERLSLGRRRCAVLDVEGYAAYQDYCNCRCGSAGTRPDEFSACHR